MLDILENFMFSANARQIRALHQLKHTNTTARKINIPRFQYYNNLDNPCGE